MSDEIELTPAERDAERTLRALRPAAARVNAAAAALEAGRRRGTRWMQGWFAAAAAAVLVAGGAWLAFGPRGRAPEVVEQRAPDAAPQFVSVGDGAVAPPTVLAYRRALGESAAALDDLLDRQAASGAAGGRAAPVMVTTFTSDPFARSM